jgi:hypothetical protein
MSIAGAGEGRAGRRANGEESGKRGDSAQVEEVNDGGDKRTDEGEDGRGCEAEEVEVEEQKGEPRPHRA